MSQLPEDQQPWISDEEIHNFLRHPLEGMRIEWGQPQLPLRQSGDDLLGFQVVRSPLVPPGEVHLIGETRLTTPWPAAPPPTTTSSKPDRLWSRARHLLRKLLRR